MKPGLRLLFAIAATGLLAGCAQHTAPTSQPAKQRWASIQIQLAEREPGPGLTPTAVEDGRTVYVAPEVLFSEREILNARALHSAGDHIVELEFTRPAAAQLARITAENQGKALAITIDGRLLTAPTIVTAIDDGFAYVAGNFSRKEAEDLAARIRPPDAEPAAKPSPARRDAKPPKKSK